MTPTITAMDVAARGTPTIRAARPDDAAAVAALFYATAPDMYDRLTGGRNRALNLIVRAFERSDTASSVDTVTLAEVDETVAAAMAAFPLSEGGLRERAFISLTMRSLPPWRWPGAVWFYVATSRVTPPAPPRSFYVDALATDPRFRRRGLATSLLEFAASEARRRGLDSVSLETALDNVSARALYAAAGFRELDSRPPRAGLPGLVALARPV